MAQMDKLLATVVSKGGLGIRLEPQQPPTLEMPGGGRLPILPDPLPSTMMELLVSEVLPPSLRDGWLLQGDARFEHRVGQSDFLIVLKRTPQGPSIVAEVIEPTVRTPTVPAMMALMPAPQPAARPEEPARPNAPTSAREAIGRIFDKPDSLSIELMDTDGVGLELVPRPPSAPRPAPPAPAPPAPAPPAPVPPAPVPPAPIELALPLVVPPEAPPVSGTSRIQALNEAPGTHPLAEKLFDALLANGGSDLHCTSYEMPNLRVNGDLEELMEFGVLGPAQLYAMMKAIAPHPSWKRFEDVSDADFAYPFDRGGCRLRVNYFMDRQGPGMVCRVIPNQLPDPNKLGLSTPVRRLADLSKGLVLVTGPTGSGKSTTLAALIDIVNQKRSDHILTIEDPIEFVHPRNRCLVNQREVGTHTESFKSGLRAALREDPDVVLVGEMRDLETISIALETAMTGHLVFGTLHTNSAIGTVDRIVDQFPADRQQQIRVMLADCLKAVMSQTLLKKVGGGRVAAIETMFATPAISNLIREGKNFQIASAMQTGRAYGQRLMNDVLIDLINEGTIEHFEAYIKCPDKESFMASLKRAGIDWDPRGEEKPMPL